MMRLAVTVVAGLALVAAAPRGASGSTIQSGPSRWASVRNQPDQLVIGNAPDGTPFRKQRHAARKPWIVGRVGGDVGHCGFVHRRWVRGGPPAAPLGCPLQIPTGTFSNGIVNSRPEKDGSPARLYTGPGCTAEQLSGYGNVSPWSSRTRPRNAVQRLPEGVRVLWRYVSRAGDWVMVHQRNPPANAPTPWFFVRRQCVAGARHIGCFAPRRCTDAERRAMRRSAFAIFRSDPAGLPFVSVERKRSGGFVEFQGVAACGPPATFFAPIPVRSDGTWRTSRRHGEITASGHFRGDLAVGTFRVHDKGCDTGAVHFEVPRCPACRPAEAAVSGAQPRYGHMTTMRATRARAVRPRRR